MPGCVVYYPETIPIPLTCSICTLCKRNLEFPETIYQSRDPDSSHLWSHSRFVVRLRTYLFIMYFLLHILLSQFFDTWLNPKCPPGAFALHYSSGSQFCFCVSACGAAAFNFVPEAIQHSASCRKCSGSVSDRSWRNLHGELHGSTRQELPAQTAEYSQMVKTCCHSNKVTRTKVPIGSVDHHFSSAWSVSW